jgi:hypothetical protein
VEYIQCWNRFQSLAEGRIDEGNLVAGERLWELVKSQDPGRRLVIRSSIDPADFVECSLDLGAGVLTCRPGSAIECDTLVFRLADGTAGRLLVDERQFTLEQAVTMILDKLVWMDSCEGQVEGAPEIELGLLAEL